jgi:hypothetical protein
VNQTKCQNCGHVISKHRLSRNGVTYVCTVDHCPNWRCGKLLVDAERMIDAIELERVESSEG